MTRSGKPKIQPGGVPPRERPGDAEITRRLNAALGAESLSLDPGFVIAQAGPILPEDWYWITSGAAKSGGRTSLRPVIVAAITSNTRLADAPGNVLLEAAASGWRPG